jgi:putative thioredoxin
MSDEDAGAWLLARVDAEANPQIAQAFGTQSVPAVVAVLAGQPVPLFQGAPSQAQVRQVLDQVLAAAKANGLAGSVPAGDVPDDDAVPTEPPLPPLHQEAYDALVQGDTATARSSYEQALRQNPRDAMARAGLAQVGLLERTASVDVSAARAAAAAAPGDVEAQLAAADVDLMDGHVDDAFGRLIALVRATQGEERERVRMRLVDLFEEVGGEDARVVAARRALANALY